MMTRRDIFFNTSWDEFDMGTCKLFVDFFNQYLPFIIFQNNKPKPKVSDKMLASINQVLELDEREQGVFFKEFENKEKLKVKEIHIDEENDRFNAIYTEIIMDTDSSEYLSFILKDGKIIFVDREGSYMDLLEEDLA